MSVVFVTSDWHLGHKKAYEWSGSFSSQEEREKHILDMYRQTVCKRDIVWFLGDIAFNLETLVLVDELPGQKRLILGNHDTDRFSRQIEMKDLLRVFDQIHSLHPYKGSWLSHAPIHPCELRGKINVHGHVHSNTVEWDVEKLGAMPDDRYVNVCLENTGFRMVKYQDILGGWRGV